MSTVIVRGDAAGLAQAIEVGRHRLTSDEPPPAGGDTGPSPYDYVLAALGA
jgi:putative redox protein